MFPSLILKKALKIQNDPVCSCTKQTFIQFISTDSGSEPINFWTYHLKDKATRHSAKLLLRVGVNKTLGRGFMGIHRDCRGIHRDAWSIDCINIEFQSEFPNRNITYSYRVQIKISASVRIGAQCSWFA